MLRVNPYITFKGNCRQAIEFYKTALGADVLFLQTVGDSPMSNMGPATNIVHCTIKVADSTIMMSDDPRPEAATGGGNISLAIGLDDPQRAGQFFGNLAEEPIREVARADRGRQPHDRRARQDAKSPRVSAGPRGVRRPRPASSPTK